MIRHRPRFTRKYTPCPYMAPVRCREAWLADSSPAFLRRNAAGCPAEDWSTAGRDWSGLVDQERSVRQVPRHGLTMTQRLFGGGEIHGDLSPSAFLNVATAIDAWTDDPDPTDAPYQRGLGERRADALDRKSTRLNSSHSCASRMPASA